MKHKEVEKLTKIMAIYVILQPILDILSNLYIDNIIPIKISTYIKPLFIFGMMLYVFFKYSNNKKNWFIYAFLFIILAIGHFYLLKKLLSIDLSLLIM